MSPPPHPYRFIQAIPLHLIKKCLRVTQPAALRVWRSRCFQLSGYARCVCGGHRFGVFPTHGRRRRSLRVMRSCRSLLRSSGGPTRTEINQLGVGAWTKRHIAGGLPGLHLHVSRKTRRRRRRMLRWGYHIRIDSNVLAICGGVDLR